MSITQYQGATKYSRNTITINYGSVEDIVAVGVYHDEDPNADPFEEDFTMVYLADGSANPLPELAKQGLIQIVSRIGQMEGVDLALTPGDYQRFTCIKTADEFDIQRIDTVTILGNPA